MFQRFFKVSIFTITLISTAAHAVVLDIPQQYQQKNQWCWAATTKAILGYYNTHLTQQQIAQFGSHGANIWIWTYGQSYKPFRSSAQNILNRWSVPNSLQKSRLTAGQLQQQINHLKRPVFIRWGWNNGGGHFVVAKGLEGNNVHLMDPWNGPGVYSYSWVVSGGGHRWTHSLTMLKAKSVNDF